MGNDFLWIHFLVGLGLGRGEPMLSLPTVGQISNNPVVNSMEFINSTLIPEEGTTFVFGSWICVADGQGGFSIHLADSQDLKMNPLSSSGNPSDLADHLSEIQLFDTIGKPTTDLDPASAGHKEIQSGTILNQ